MSRTFLLFGFCISAAMASKPSPKLAKVRVALRELNAQFLIFNEIAEAGDANLAELRRLVLRHRYKDAESLAQEIAPRLRATARQWAKLEDLYTKYRRAGLNLNLPNPGHVLFLDPDFKFYLSLKRNNRFHNGTPIEVLMRSWRGLRVGEKLESPPASLRRTGLIANLKVGATDSVLIMTVSGGLIRGRIEGFADENLVLREVMPNALRKNQMDSGHFRSLKLEEVARLEVIRKPPSIAAQETPPPTVSLEGDYSPYYVQKGYVFRVYYQPDDVELFQMVREGRARGAEHNPRVSPVNIEVEAQPFYAAIFFLDCEELLKRR